MEHGTASDHAARAAHREIGSVKGEQSIIREKDQAKQQGVQVGSRDRRPRVSTSVHVYGYMKEEGKLI